MCMKIFALQRCYSVAEGGCDKYWAEEVGVQDCGRYCLPGLPGYPECKGVWAGFEDTESSKVNPHTFYQRRPKACPICPLKEEFSHVKADIEKLENSAHVQGLIQAERTRAEQKEAAYKMHCFNEMWNTTRALIASLQSKADAIWNGIETALHGHFGAHGMANPVVQGLAASLVDAKKELVGHVESTTKEMATALVGPCHTFDLEREEAEESARLRDSGMATD
ncbi:hypothetical protein CCHL11_09240 [Colletotrichum chlorophyti]|uniref:Uncharacterized protein n=1 Tax=Colletotrichum chlorophyti TaxID=708187 RepID=A0A1Q8RCS8_9PEZI|nr:hypothetical protein CCHL11_09240 [Colletotrichum chlorophyti]